MRNKNTQGMRHDTETHQNSQDCFTPPRLPIPLLSLSQKQNNLKTSLVFLSTFMQQQNTIRKQKNMVPAKSVKHMTEPHEKTEFFTKPEQNKIKPTPKDKLINYIDRKKNKINTQQRSIVALVGSLRGDIHRGSEPNQIAIQNFSRARTFTTMPVNIKKEGFTPLKKRQNKRRMALAFEQFILNRNERIHTTIPEPFQEIYQSDFFPSGMGRQIKTSKKKGQIQYLGVKNTSKSQFKQIVSLRHWKNKQLNQKQIEQPIRRKLKLKSQCRT